MQKSCEAVRRWIWSFGVAAVINTSGLATYTDLHCSPVRPYSAQLTEALQAEVFAHRTTREGCRNVVKRNDLFSCFVRVFDSSFSFAKFSQCWHARIHLLAWHACMYMHPEAFWVQEGFSEKGYLILCTCCTRSYWLHSVRYNAYCYWDLRTVFDRV